MPTIVFAVIASTLSSLLGLLGGFGLLAGSSWVQKYSKYFVSFAAGAMLSAAFFDLLTDAIDRSPASIGTIFAWTLAGFMVFFLIEKFLLWHHHTHTHADGEDTPQLAKLIIIGDAVHNAIDGMVIAAAFVTSPALGIATATAVFFHEIPQELGDFSIMIHSGMKRSRVALWNILGALVSPVATVIAFTYVNHSQTLITPLLGLAAGSFLYIASADLVPQIHRERKLSSTIGQLTLLVLGMLAIVAVGAMFAE